MNNSIRNFIPEKNVKSLKPQWQKWDISQGVSPRRLESQEKVWVDMASIIKS